jgi:hypothetical protein
MKTLRTVALIVGILVPGLAFTSMANAASPSAYSNDTTFNHDKHKNKPAKMPKNKHKADKMPKEKNKHKAEKMHKEKNKPEKFKLKDQGTKND